MDANQAAYNRYLARDAVARLEREGLRVEDPLREIDTMALMTDSERSRHVERLREAGGRRTA